MVHKVPAARATHVQVEVDEGSYTRQETKQPRRGVVGGTVANVSVTATTVRIGCH